MVGMSHGSRLTRLALLLLALTLLAVQFAVGITAAGCRAGGVTYVRLKNKWQNTYL